ncbi:hypothetical protein C7M84_012490 [Penaeus vannamei]|uniref:INO80 complex subunit E N-terminal domain-containing protein n=1 Tax=Penaeus vannamei TaxID=6689 RepID=A0A3R7Q5R6_PENVA|nr:hypothetical protein C7M84_012490 [Penaeus vannamei]
MHKLQVLLLVVCVAVGPSLAQITFSRSWVPQGKRSGGGGPDGPEGPAHVRDCRDVTVTALAQVAAHVSDMMEEVKSLRPTYTKSPEVMMHKLQVLLLVVCVAVGPSLAQITFSRSWVPQGKRSGVAGALMAPEGPAHLGESCHGAYVEALMQVAAVVNVSFIMPVQTDGPEDYKANYKTLKRKLKLLIYENECFQEELRKAQRALLRVRRDKSFLLDRLLQYHRGPDSSSDSEQTEESDTENDAKLDTKSCRKRLSLEGSGGGSNSSQGPLGKPPLKKKKSSSNSSSSSKSSKQGSKQWGYGTQACRKQLTLWVFTCTAPTRRPGMGGSTGVAHTSDGQLSREEVERRLAARQPMNDFTTTVSLTLPNQLFSDNIMEGDFMEEEVETSPSYVEEDVTVDYD